MATDDRANTGVLLVDQVGSYYLIPLKLLEQCRVPEDVKPIIDKLTSPELKAFMEQPMYRLLLSSSVIQMPE